MTIPNIARYTRRDTARWPNRATNREAAFEIFRFQNAPSVWAQAGILPRVLLVRPPTWPCNAGRKMYRTTLAPGYVIISPLEQGAAMAQPEIWIMVHSGPATAFIELVARAHAL